MFHLSMLHRDNTEFIAVSLKHQLDEKATLEHPEVTYSLSVSLEFYCYPC